MYLGVDTGKKAVDWSATECRRSYKKGKCTREEFGEVLDKLKPIAVGIEWTGRLAQPYALIAERMGYPVFIIHSATRKGYTTLAGQSTKTDPLDAKTIAKTLSLWHNLDHRADVDIATNTFTPYAIVKPAWHLRGLMADYDAKLAQRTRAKQRYEVHTHVGEHDRAAIWLDDSKSKAPEDALKIAHDYAHLHYKAEFEALMSIPGVGDVISLWILATLMPIERFAEPNPGHTRDKTQENVKRYLGMHPKKQQSGDKEVTETERGGHRRIRGLLAMSGQQSARDTNSTMFAASYNRHVEAGRGGYSAVNRVGHLYLKVIISLLQRPRPFEDRVTRRVYHSKVRASLRVPVRLVKIKDAREKALVSPSNLSNLMTRGHLETEIWEGKRYVLRPSLDKYIARTSGKKEAATNGKD
jgi:Transposase IS116/IS110/IS902 family/Transposase